MKYSNRFVPMIRGLLLLTCFVSSLYIAPLPALATSADFLEEAEERKEDTVDTNEIPGWPQGPKIGAASAILMDADTGTILYSKNINAREFPASTTKLMTALVAYENSQLNEIVTVNQSAIDANASDGSNMGLNAGEQLTMEELLYGVMVNSANEGCNAIGEHIAGSMEGYVALMNQKAQELGLENTHYVTTNGLHDDEHYTSAYDLAIIAREFFQYDLLCQMASTSRYVIPATDTHLEHVLNSHNRLYEGAEYAYEYLVGSKTGFTSTSRQCLVSCAEKDGLRLICVIIKEESPYQFEDTVQLFDYGFANFTKTNILQLDSTYQLQEPSMFQSSGQTKDSTTHLIVPDAQASLLLPNGITLEDLQRDLAYTPTNPELFAEVTYSYGGQVLGSLPLRLANLGTSSSYLTNANAQTEEGGLDRPNGTDGAGDLSGTNGADDLSGTDTLPRTPKIIDIRWVVGGSIGGILLLFAVGFYFLRRTASGRRRRKQYRRRPAPVKYHNSRNQREANGSIMLQPITPAQRKKAAQKKPSLIETQILRLLRYISQFSEAQNVEKAREERHRREQARIERILEDLETRRIEGQSSIRSQRPSTPKKNPFEQYEHQQGQERPRRNTDADANSHYKRNTRSAYRPKQRQGYEEDADAALLERQRRRRELAEKRRREES